MRVENVRSVFVRPIEGRESLSKAEIAKGLSSKDLREKEKALNQLVVNLINDAYYEQNIMTIINHILPYQSKSATLKKLVLVYWEVIKKRKHDGVLLDEFLLVCNNLRNDLNHANEFVVGMTLKLIGRIAVREIIDSLLPPVLENGLKHVEAFVRRNAVECLFELYRKFGEDVVHGIDERMLEILGRESDTNTKRNALMLLFKVNPAAAVSYCQRTVDNEGIEGFGDIIQLVVVRNLFELCKRDAAGKQKYLRLILEFINSPFSPVLFEIGNSIAEFSANATVISAAVHQLLKILQDIPDVSIKLVILQKLFYLRGLSGKYIEGAVPECLKLLETENTEVRIKALKLVQSYINQSNVDEFLLKLRKLSQTTNDPGINERLNDKLRKNVFRALITVVRNRMASKYEFKEEAFKDLFVSLIESEQKNHQNVALVKSFLEITFAARETFKTDFTKLAINSFLNVQNSEILSTLFTLVSQEMETEKQAEDLLDKFTDLSDALKETVKRASAKQEAAPVEVKKVQTVKTVIKEDGSYGTEIVEEVTGPAQATLEFSKYKFLIAMLTGNSVFLINFFRNVTGLIRLLNRESRKGRSLIAKFCQAAFLLYSLKQREANKEEFVFTELNQLVKEMLSESTAVQRIAKPKLSVASVKTTDLGTPADKPSVQFDQPLSFRVLKYANQQQNPCRL